VTVPRSIPITSVTTRRHSVKRGHWGGQVLLHAILLVFAIVSVGPFIWMVFSSFKNFRELVSSSDLLPHVWTLTNYTEIINRVNFLDAMRNSIVVAASQTVAVMLTSLLCGYVFSKYRFWGKNALFALLLATMMVPFAVLLVPLYIFISDIGVSDNLLGVILPSLWSAFGIFLMRQFMETIPSELLDAARIDGTSEWRIIGQVVLPLSAAPLAALAVITFLTSWDAFLWPSIVLSSADRFTIPLVLAGLKNLYWTRYDMWMAGAMLTVIPVMALYVVASKHFIRGIAMTGLKG